MSERGKTVLALFEKNSGVCCLSEKGYTVANCFLGVLKKTVHLMIASSAEKIATRAIDVTKIRPPTRLRQTNTSRPAHLTDLE